MFSKLMRCKGYVSSCYRKKSKYGQGIQREFYCHRYGIPTPTVTYYWGGFSCWKMFPTRPASGKTDNSVPFVASHCLHDKSKCTFWTGLLSVMKNLFFYIMLRAVIGESMEKHNFSSSKQIQTDNIYSQSTETK